MKLDSGSLYTLIKLADEGYGFTLLPTLHADDLTPEQQKNIRHFNDPIPTREVSLIYHQTNLRKSFEESLIETIQSVIRGKIFIDKVNNVTSPLLSIA